MGISASRKVETKLRESPRFQAAIGISFQECIALSQQTDTAAGLFFYQLCSASHRIYDLISSPADDAEDPAFLLKQRWLPYPPAQADVDFALRKGGFTHAGKQFLTLAEFHEFAGCLFRDMAITAAVHRVSMYVPMGSIAMVAVHLSARRVPAYRAAGLLAPAGILGSVTLATLLALGFSFP